MSATLHKATSCKDVDTIKAPATVLVTIAGSAGAFRGLWHILSALPPALKAAVAVALHTGTGSALAQTLELRSRLSVFEAESGDLLRDASVYVARPHTHLVVNPDGRLSISAAAPVRLFRPSADWLFESASASYRERHVAVVLSGLLSDGADKLGVVKRLGGTVIAQSPADASYSSMPLSAVATGCVDHVVDICDMPAAISAAVDRCFHESDVSSWESPFAGDSSSD